MILSENIVAFLDNSGAARFVDPIGGKQYGVQQLAQEASYVYFRGDSSEGGYLCLFLSKDVKTILLEYDKDLRQFKQKAVLEWSIDAAEVSSFSFDGSLLAVGDNGGRVCVYRADIGKLLTIAPRCNEYISAVAFNGDSSLIAYASFKKNLTIYDLSRFTPLCDYLNKEVICAIAFLRQTSLVAIGGRDNRVFLFDPINGYVARELITTINWPISIYVDKDDQFCFVSDKAGYLYFIDLTTTERDQEPIFNSKQAIVDIKRRGEEIYFAFEDGRVCAIDLAIERERFTEALNQRNMSALHEMMQANPILRFSAAGMMNDMDAQFDERFTKATINVAQGKLDLARSDMGDLLSYPVYNSRFEAVVKHAAKVATFWQLIQTGQYYEAYTLAGDGDFYRKLPLFTLLENRFVERFNEALKNLNGDNPDPKKARDDLALYMKTPNKDSAIKNMLKNPEIFKRAQNAYDRKDWADLARLINKFRMLKDSPPAVAYQEMIKKEEERFLGFMLSGKYDEAFGSAKFLKENGRADVPILKIEFDKLDIVARFNEIVNAKQYGAAMQMAIKNPFLITSNAYKLLDKTLSARFKAAHLYAVKRHFEAVDKMLRPFLTNPFSSNRAIGVYKTLYLEQIGALGAQMRQNHWLNALKNYVSRFGLDGEIELIVKKYDQQRLLEPFREFKTPNFLRYPLIKNIVTEPFAKPTANPRT
jgi:DNA-binding beta-propeller fold protein YncE